ncbi:hypothetical protein [Agreia sp. VKM Ac-1783]|uniref:hypothetical protein n=1 Tax=Agreia sp. VKM Ac-1783 TaxID=1938889 RepID=UPI000A2AD99F|nr:hypothetical protein [Agreia sp. VKM Ac-1783]SMQ73452.1 hypothetical protein SAMN06295943_2883 [Agreia sp. VKM Ac-1783]
MARNGHLDISTLVDWDGHGNYLTPEAYRQWLAWRLAVYRETGEWMFTSEAYRPEGNRGDLAAGNYNTQWYWWEWYDGDSRFAARPGTTSAHGLAEAVDIISTVYGNNGDSEMHHTIERLGRLYGWVFDIPGEPWHAHYIGNPTITAALDIQPLGDENMAWTEEEATLVREIHASLRQPDREGFPGAPSTIDQIQYLAQTLLGDPGTAERVRIEALNRWLVGRLGTEDGPSLVDRVLAMEKNIGLILAKLA